jgi:hypothetical protein
MEESILFCSQFFLSSARDQNGALHKITDAVPRFSTPKITIDWITSVGLKIWGGLETNGTHLSLEINLKTHLHQKIWKRKKTILKNRRNFHFFRGIFYFFRGNFCPRGFQQ